MLDRLFDIRKGEGKRAFLSFFSLLLVIASYTTVKSVRDALFLSKFGITQLSFVAIGLALLIGFIIAFYLRHTSGLARNKLIWGTNILVSSSLVAIWFGLFMPGLTDLLPWVLYIWSSVFGVFIVMQFWLLANDIFDTREAKRLFGIVGAGAIAGGISGGFLSRSLASVLGTSNLLLLAAAMLILEAILVSFLWPLRKNDLATQIAESKEAPQNNFSVMWSNNIVRLMAFALLFSTVATTLVDWQFKGIVKDAFVGRTDEMAAFFGSLYAFLSIASFVIQSFFSAAILKRFGVGIGLLLLPVSLLLSSTLILTYQLIPWVTRLFAASTAKVAEGGLRFAIDKASMELMWLPVPPHIKEKGKSFVDTLVDRLGTGLTGFIWLALAAMGLGSPDRIHLVSIAVGVVIVIWLFVLVRAKKEYVGALRDGLMRRSINLNKEALSIDNAEVKAQLNELLSRDDEKSLYFALYLLEHSTSDLPNLDRLLKHSSKNLTIATLNLLAEHRDNRHFQAAMESLRSNDQEIVIAAIRYFQTSEASLAFLSDQKDSDSKSLQLAHKLIALAFDSKSAPLKEDIYALCKKDSHLIQYLASAPRDFASDLIAPYLKDNDQEIVKAAIFAAGEAKALFLANHLIEKLDDQRYRIEASEALLNYGEAITDRLADKLNDPDLPKHKRYAIIKLLGRAHPAVVPTLIHHLRCNDPKIIYRVLNALSRLRNRHLFELNQEQKEYVEHAIETRFKLIARYLLWLEGGSWTEIASAQAPSDYYVKALLDRIDTTMREVFYLLALIYDPDDIYNAYLGVKSPLKTTRARSIEFLDNLLPKSQTKLFLVLLENYDAERFAEIVKKIFEIDSQDVYQQIEFMLKSNDQLLRHLAIWKIGQDKIERFGDTLNTFTQDPDPFIQEEARFAQFNLADKPSEDKTMGMTTIEKALKLQRTDVLVEASIEDLSYIAEIATQVEIKKDTTIYHEGDAPDALYIVISGEINLTKGKREIAHLKEGESFGGWALVDESPRVASAIALEDSNLLRVKRDDFIDLLADRVDLVQAIFKSMTKRLRTLAEVTQNK